jgi:uncharacterized protein (TIGR00255 family)
MLRSMTGFARAERATTAGLLAWEIRSVNHRYLEVSLRLPEDLRGSEAEYRRAIGVVARRGKVDASFYVRPAATAGRELALDGRAAAARRGGPHRCRRPAALARRRARG